MAVPGVEVRVGVVMSVCKCLFESDLRGIDGFAWAGGGVGWAAARAAPGRVGVSIWQAVRPRACPGCLNDEIRMMHDETPESEPRM